ncbi:MAG: hypothetical protein ISF22_04640 [Methanomassiliicoccus sp.]|nr:hypothetical protein [Methanomassiliicoccus sp.]
MRSGIDARLSVAAIAVVAVVIVAAIAIPLLFLNYRTVAVDEVRTVPLEGAGRLDLQVTATVGEMEVRFGPLDGDAVKVRATIRGHSGLFGGESPLRINITSANLSAGQAVAVALDTYAPWPYYSLDRVNYTIVVEESLRTALNISVTTGGIALSTASGVVLEGLELNSTVKGAAVSLENGTVLAGNVRIQTATGGSVLSWNNVTVAGPCNLTLLESSGPITARFDQAAPMGGSVNVLVSSTVGEVQVGFGLSGPVSARTICSWSLGEPEMIDRGGFGGTPLWFQSDNYPDGALFSAQVNQTLGNIVVEGRWTG